MSIQSHDKTSPYPKWVNIVSSLLLPGSGQFLSGRKLAGVIWFFIAQVAFLGAAAATVTMLVTLKTAVAALWLGVFVTRVLIVVDSCRKSIPHLQSKWWAGFCVLVIAIPLGRMSAVRQFMYRSFSIPTASMQPTLMGKRKSADDGTVDGDHLIVDECSYHFRLPARGEIAVFRTEGIAESERETFATPLHQYYVKRIVGLPGERVSVRSSDIYINGNKLSDAKIIGHISVDTNVPPDSLSRMLPDKEVQLGADEYFVVGDNIVNSLDSRYFGAIKREYILGRVAWIFWPLDRSGIVQ